jgi:uncharacterized protein
MSSFPIPITTIFTGLLALMLVGVSIRVTVLRARKKIEFFDGGDKELGRAIRVQGNFVEYVPMALMLLGMLEWMGTKPWIVYALGVALVVARVIHAWGLYSSVFNARVVGTSLNWLVLAVGGLLALSVVA